MSRASGASLGCSDQAPVMFEATDSPAASLSAGAGAPFGAPFATATCHIAGKKQQALRFFEHYSKKRSTLAHVNLATIFLFSGPCNCISYFRLSEDAVGADHSAEAAL